MRTADAQSLLLREGEAKPQVLTSAKQVAFANGQIAEQSRSG